MAVEGQATPAVYALRARPRLDCRISVQAIGHLDELKLLLRGHALGTSFALVNAKVLAEENLQEQAAAMITLDATFPCEQ